MVLDFADAGVAEAPSVMVGAATPEPTAAAVADGGLAFAAFWRDFGGVNPTNTTTAPMIIMTW